MSSYNARLRLSAARQVDRPVRDSVQFGFLGPRLGRQTLAIIRSVGLDVHGESAKGNVTAKVDPDALRLAMLTGYETETAAQNCGCDIFCDCPGFPPSRCQPPIPGASSPRRV